MVLLIVEQVISNPKLLSRSQALIAVDILPMLAQKLDSRVEECRFGAVKWTSDIIQQLALEEVTSETRTALAEFFKRQIIPRAKILVVQANPVGSTTLKLLRAFLDFEPSLRDLLFSSGIPSAVLSFFEINHEKCNANTIKVISYLVDSPQMKLKSLTEENFFDRMFGLFSNISDIVQGEEIIELLNVYFRKVFKEAKMDIYALEATKKNKKDILLIIGDKLELLKKIHDKSVELLSDLQGTHPADLLETLLYTDMLLYSLEGPEDHVVSTTGVQLLLGLLLAIPENGVINLITHIVHLHNYFPSGRMIYKSESKLGLKVLEKLKSLSLESVQYYMNIFE